MSLAELHATVQSSARRSLVRPEPTLVFFALTAALTFTIVASYVLSLSSWNSAAAATLPLVALTGLWISGGAATAVLGLSRPDIDTTQVPESWTPASPTALLITLCGEDPAPIARALDTLQQGLERIACARAIRIFVLSDTHDPIAIHAEKAALADLIRDARITYRRRSMRTRRKPGNIADWLQIQGDAFDYMLVLDADSRMSPARIRRMIWQMETRPRLGLLQAGIALLPGTTRFDRHQRIGARLLSRNFGRGFAAWTGDSGNYWGHNAIMRVAAFRAAASLPRLRGSAPLGGDLLSHDFIEAAWIRRAGWAVALDPDMRGSAESAPETLEEFYRRDRRWCQGNLQHLRLLTAPGLSPISRMHLAAGILSYLVAPIWLSLVVLAATGTVPASSLLPLIVMALVLIIPKLCALADGMGRARTSPRRRVALRAWAAEIGVSAVIAPLIMLRQAGAVFSVLAGRDCGWKSAGSQGWRPAAGLPEMGAGLALAALAWVSGGTVALLWLLPVVGPLLAAPWLNRAMCRVV